MAKYLVSLGKNARGLPWNIVGTADVGVYGPRYPMVARCGVPISMLHTEWEFGDNTIYRVCPDCRVALVAERLDPPPVDLIRDRILPWLEKNLGISKSRP